MSRTIRNKIKNDVFNPLIPKYIFHDKVEIFIFTGKEYHKSISLDLYKKLEACAQKAKPLSKFKRKYYTFKWAKGYKYELKLNKPGKADFKEFLLRYLSEDDLSILVSKGYILLKEVNVYKIDINNITDKNKTLTHGYKPKGSYKNKKLKNHADNDSYNEDNIPRIRVNRETNDPIWDDKCISHRINLKINKNRRKFKQSIRNINS